jgi:hypothetical protein
MKWQMLGLVTFAHFHEKPVAIQFGPRVFPVVARLITAGRKQTPYSQKSSAFRVRVWVQSGI